MLYAIIHTLVYIAMSLCFFVRIKGRKNLPPKGTPLLICANHTGYSDPIFVALGVGPFRPLRYMAKATIFKSAIKRFFLNALGAFPIEQRESDIRAIKKSIEVIEEKQPLLVFPEGSRRLKGIDKIPPLPGIGMIAVKSKCMILPVFVTPYLSLFHRKTVSIGEPYYPDTEGKRKPSELYRAIAVDVMDRIEGLAREVGEAW